MRLNLAETLRRGLAIAVANRVLWLYGFLLVLVSGDCFGAAGNIGGDRDEWRDVAAFFGGMDSGLRITILIAAAALVLLYWVLSVLVGNWAIGALLAGANQAAEEGNATFGRSAALGWRHFWPILVIGLISGTVALTLLLPMAALGAAAALAGQPLLAVGICLWFPLVLLGLLALGILVTVSQVQVVLHDTGPLQALHAGWELLARHWWELLVVWLVNEMAIGCGAGCLVALVVAVTVLPAVIGFLVNPALGVALLLPTLGLLLVVALGMGVLRVFQRTVWLLACQELATTGHPE
ncbi:MAG: hypothetical protein HYY02_12620 [Chloroflexi bacterium]|nr:hypothetical protein [Chloroflexota bacterium]